MKVLSLFSGGGLGDLGLTKAGMEIVGQVEIEKFCQKILALRFPDAHKWEDVRNVTGKEIIKKCGAIDLVSGGFPCQPFSQAGKRLGEKDERNLWEHMHRIICEVRPRWVLAENVPGLLSIDHGRTFGKVVADLAKSGFCVEWDCIPASALGAPHQRDRVWIVARCGGDIKSPNSGLLRSKKRKKQTAGFKQLGEEMADPNKKRLQRRKNYRNDEKNRTKPYDKQSSGCSKVCDTASAGFQNRSNFALGRSEPISEFERSNWWSAEPDVGRVAHGVANRVDRLKLLGNGQVVQVVEWIGKRIMELEK